MAGLRAGWVALGLALATAGPWVATPAPAAEAAVPDDGVKAAFEALPEPTRRALQDALIWTGDYVSVVSGSFGPRTRDALAAYAKRTGLPFPPMLDAPARAKLIAFAQTARAEVGMAEITDARTGLRIALPLKLLPKHAASGSGTRYMAPDGAVVVDTLAKPLVEGGLADTYQRMIAPAPNRTITYKLLRSDFFVVSGEAGDRKFYGRYAAGGPEGATALHGFTLSYPKAAAKRLDPVALAVAASFDPFPAPEEAAPLPPAKPPAASVPRLAGPSGMAVAVGPGLALTTVASAGCPRVSVDGRPATWRKGEPASSLALLDVPGLTGAPVGVGTAPPEAGLEWFALFRAGPAPGRLLASSGTVRGATGGAPAGIEAPLQDPAQGTALIDASGGLAGLVGSPASPPVTIAGTRLSGRYPLVDASDIRALLQSAGVPLRGPSDFGPALTMGGAVALWKSAVVQLACG